MFGANFAGFSSSIWNIKPWIWKNRMFLSIKCNKKKTFEIVNYTYLVYQELHKSLVHICQLMARIWYRDQYALEYRNRNCRFQKNSIFSIHIRWPGKKRRFYSLSWTQRRKKTNSRRVRHTFKPFSNINSALAPRTVQWTAIFSLRLMPNDRTVYRALENTGGCPVNCSSTWEIMVRKNISEMQISYTTNLNLSRTFAARVKRSPDSPTQIFKHNFRIWISRIELEFELFPSFWAAFS